MPAEIKIFIVDDDELFVLLTKRTIKNTQIASEIFEFSDGGLAIDYLKKIAENTALLPDVIFLDLSMPFMDGWGFLNEYKLLQPQFGKNIRIHILSSSISPFDIERAKDFDSVTEFIVKPILKPKLVDILGGLGNIKG